MSELHKGHRDRLKNRCLSEGLVNFPDHTKLELLLFYAIPRVDTNELAHILLNHFGTLSAVFDAPYDELVKVKGITKNAAVLIKLVPQYTAAYMEDHIKDLNILDTPGKVGAFLIPKFVGHTNEVVYVVSLSPQKRVISCRLVFEGSIESVQVPVRRIVEVCIQSNASSVIVAHNHPGGIALPSRDDYIAANQITKTLGSIGIDVTDHIVVAGDNFISMGKCEKIFDDIKFI